MAVPRLGVSVLRTSHSYPSLKRGVGVGPSSVGAGPSLLGVNRYSWGWDGPTGALCGLNLGFNWSGCRFRRLHGHYSHPQRARHNIIFH